MRVISLQGIRSYKPPDRAEVLRRQTATPKAQFWACLMLASVSALGYWVTSQALAAFCACMTAMFGFYCLKLGLVFFETGIPIPAGYYDDQLNALSEEYCQHRAGRQIGWRRYPLSGNQHVLISDLGLSIIDCFAGQAMEFAWKEITQCAVSSRMLGSASEGRIHMAHYAPTSVAVSVGSTRTSTTTHYAFLVDVYTSANEMPHLLLNFGENESYAKQAYSLIQNLTSRR
jgi:hypothetical protein